MGFKRLLKKGVLGGLGYFVLGHLQDAILKKKLSGKTYKECLAESVKETITEDFPGTSHLYQMGRQDGKQEGTIEQAHRDEKKMKEMNKKHEKDRKEWEEIDNEKDSLIDELFDKIKQ